MFNNIILLASLPTNDIENRLKALLKKCDAVRGVVAYWTIPTKFFSEWLLHALNRPGSFYCVDIHRPTSIDALKRYVKGGAEIYLHAYELETEITGEKMIPPGLLHSKMILFDLPGGKAELWVGSHNFSRRAIKGINVEASISIEVGQASFLYQQSKQYLEKIRDNCNLFNPDDIDYYKLLQGNTSEAVLGRLLKKADRRILVRKALDILGYDVLNLHGKTIQLIGLGTGKLQSLSNSRTLLILQALDLNTNDEITYIAQIQQAGLIDVKNPQLYGKSEVSIRHALIGKDTMPKLEKETIVKESILAQADYFVNIKILEYRVEETYSLPKEILWEPVPDASTWFPNKDQDFTKSNTIFYVNENGVVTTNNEKKSFLKRASLNKEIVLQPFTLRSIDKDSKQLFLEFYENLKLQATSNHLHLPDKIRRDKVVSERRVVLYS